MKNLSRFVSLFSLAAASVAAHAGIFISSIAQSGAPTNGIGSFVGTITTNFGSDFPFNAFSGNVAMNFTGGVGSTALYTSTAGSVTVSFNSTPDSVSNTTLSFSSPATITKASGVFVPYVGLGGITASSTTRTDTGANAFTIAYPLPVPVPEPGTLAVFGLGIVPFFKRRRK